VLVVAVVALVSYVVRRRLFQAVAVMAEAVEEVADAVEDAAEDLAEAAETRAKGDGAAD
jgi:histone H3/H4